MASISNLSLDFSSGTDANSRTVRVRYKLTLTGTEHAFGSAYGETITLFAQDFGIEADELAKKTGRTIKLNSGVGVANTFRSDPSGVQEEFELSWPQSRRSLAEDPDPPFGLTNMDEFVAKVELKPIILPALKGTVTKQQNFG